MTIIDEVEELREYAKKDNTEFGNYCLLLCKLFQFSTHIFMDTEFYNVLKNRIRDNLKEYKNF